MLSLFCWRTSSVSYLFPYTLCGYLDDICWFVNHNNLLIFRVRVESKIKIIVSRKTDYPHKKHCSAAKPANSKYHILVREAKYNTSEIANCQNEGHQSSFINFIDFCFFFKRFLSSPNSLCTLSLLAHQHNRKHVVFNLMQMHSLLSYPIRNFWNGHWRRKLSTHLIGLCSEIDLQPLW